MLVPPSLFFFFFNDTATTEIYTLSLHDALPISLSRPSGRAALLRRQAARSARLGNTVGEGQVRDCDEHDRDLSWPLRSDHRSEEHTSELQSPCNLVCRLLLEKKKKKKHALRLSH